MSKLFDYVVHGGDELAAAQATIEHMGGCLEREIELHAKTRKEIDRLREEVELWKDRCAAERQAHEATIENCEDMLNRRSS